MIDLFITFSLKFFFFFILSCEHRYNNVNCKGYQYSKINLLKITNMKSINLIN